MFRMSLVCSICGKVRNPFSSKSDFGLSLKSIDFGNQKLFVIGLERVFRSLVDFDKLYPKTFDDHLNN